MRYLLPVVLAAFLFSCSSTRSLRTKDDGKLTVTFVQINDVYEIAPLEGGKSGGVARVATLKKQELAKNPNTVMVIAGDFLSPSVYNSLKYEGERVRGKQMVESLNAAGLDIAVFGNHEFDINEKELLSRLNDSKFQWVSSNTFHKTADGVQPFAKTISGSREPFPPYWFMNFSDADGTTAKVGFIGLNLPFNKAPYVTYTDAIEVADSLYSLIRDSCDAVVAITHLALEEDSLLATRVPGLALIMGGHEHDMKFLKVGDIYITKAHANAKSAYVNRLTINKSNGTTSVTPKLVMIDTSFDLDSATSEVVNKWVRIANENFSSLGFDAGDVVIKAGPPLEGREEIIRRDTSNLTKLVVRSMEHAAPNADMVIINSGAIRVDDILHPPVTQYDIIRTLPYGGFIMGVDMKGSLVKQVLEAGRNNVDNGGFLQYSSSVVYKNNTWTWKGEPIEDDKVYHVGIADFLMTGGEANMGFLTKDNPGVIKVYPQPGEDDLKRDVRLAIVDYLKQ